MSKYDDVLLKHNLAPIANEKPKQNKYDAIVDKYTTPSTGERQGRALPSPMQGAVHGLNEAMFGFLPKVVGGANAALNTVTGGRVGASYQDANDTIQGMIDQYANDYRTTAMVTGLATSIPMSMALPAAKLGTGAGIGVNMARAALPAALYGGLNAVGHSRATDAGGLIQDAVKGALISSAMGGVTVPVAAVGRGIGQRISGAFGGKSGNTFAQEKVAEALARDYPNAVDPLAVVEGRLRGLGGEVRYPNINSQSSTGAILTNKPVLADAGKANTQALFDVLSQMNGTASNKLFDIVKNRAMTRGKMIAEGADKALATGGKVFSDNIDDLIAKRSADASPLYAQLDNVRVPVDNDLITILNRVRPAWGKAETIAKYKGDLDSKLSDVVKGLSSGNVSFKKLDLLKQSLDDIEVAARRSGENQLAGGVTQARQALIAKLESVSPIDAQGGNIYRMARESFSTPSRIIDASEKGRLAFTTKSLTQKEINKLTPDELEGFRVGVVQAIKEKAGSQAGQTQLLKWMENPNTENALNTAFGSNFKQFAKTLWQQEQLKKLQGNVGGNSKTFQRLMSESDLGREVLGDVGAITAAAKTGNFAGMMAAGKNLYGRTELPEPIRNEITRILTLPKNKAIPELQRMALLMKKLQETRAGRAQTIGKMSGTVRFNNGQNSDEQ